MIIEPAPLMDRDSAANDCGGAIQVPGASQLLIGVQHELLFVVAMLARDADLVAEESTAETQPKVQPLAEILRDDLLIIRNRLRCSFVHFKLCAHFL